MKSAENGVRQRLPTLDEVLTRKSRPPVDLFCFYIFLQREGNEDSLDFWLDVHQHENLCRAYFKDVRKSGKHLKNEWPQYWNQALAEGSSYDAVAGITSKDRQSYHTSSTHNLLSTDSSPPQPNCYGEDGRGGEGGILGAGARSPSVVGFADSQERLDEFSGGEKEYGGGDGRKVGSGRGVGGGARQRKDTESGGGLEAPLRNLDGGRSSPVQGSFPNSPNNNLISAPSTSTPHNRTSSGWTTGHGWGLGGGAGGRGSVGQKRKSKAPTVIPRTAAITKGELLLSAERIYARYLLPGGEKEIYLPPNLRITSFPQPSQLSHPDSNSLTADGLALASVPDMFLSQKAYVHTTLVSDAFPRFLRAKAFGNLTPATVFLRLLLGLVVLWAGLVAAFCFVFLDIKPRRLRLSLLVPFYLSTHLLLSALYSLDPLLVLLFNRSETTPLHHLPIQETYVRKLLRKRSVWLEFVICLVTLAWIMIWYWIPGHRL